MVVRGPVRRTRTALDRAAHNAQSLDTRDLAMPETPDHPVLTDAQAAVLGALLSRPDTGPGAPSLASAEGRQTSRGDMAADRCSCSGRGR